LLQNKCLSHFYKGRNDFKIGVNGYNGGK